MKQLYIFIGLFFIMSFAQITFALLFKKHKKNNFSLETRFKKDFLVNFGRRLKVSWTLFFILIIGFSLGKVGITLLFLLLSFLALREFMSIMHLRASDYWPMFCAFYIFLPLQYFFVLTDAQFLFYIFIPVYVFLMSPLISVIGDHDNEMFFERTSKFQWAQISCIYCLSYAPAISSIELRNGQFQSSSLLLFLLLVIFSSDAFQYVLGNLIGKKKIAPKLSPNKTWEGTVYGILTATFFGTLLYSLTPFKWWQAAIICFILCLVGFLGGLVMSGIKRSLNIKDWGDILGAHGGVLDRFDSFVFTAPLFYHLCKHFYS